MLDGLKKRSKKLKKEVYVIYLAYRDPRVLWWKKTFLGLVIGYLFSPIDLIPDFIPVLGYLDDLILVPLGVWLSIKLIPVEVLRECRKLSQEEKTVDVPVGKKMAIIIGVTWVIGLIFLVLWLTSTIDRIV